ncbi:DNA primase [Thermaurantiacus sp.]
MNLPEGFLDELKARTSLPALVGRRVKLVRAGRDLKGCCPFHHEKTASFHVYPDHYHCFGCGAHGDAIGWLMAQEGLDFMGAVRALAEAAGMAVPEPGRGQAARTEPGIRDLLEAAARWFAERLEGPEGGEARAYLERRGIPLALAARFGLGFAPGRRDALASALLAALPGVKPEALVAAGLLGTGDDGRHFDRFRGRLIFPIHDARGRVVGFGGRLLEAGEPKYLNSAEAPHFRKGRLLYNLHRAAPAARRAGRLLVVEGYMDVIGLARAGIEEAVAPLGTAFTEDQMRLLWTIAPEPVLAFDGDAAGARAAHRAAIRALPLLRPGRSLRFLALPRGTDPDDLAREGGAAAIEALVAAARPLDAFLFEAEAAAAPTDTPERRAYLRELLDAHAKAIPDPALARDYRATFRRRFEAAFGPAPRTNPQERPAPRRPAPPLHPETRRAADPASYTLARLLASFVARPAAVPRFEEALGQLEIRDRRLAFVRDTLLAGQPVDPGLLGMVSPLVAAGESDACFDRIVALDLAARLSHAHVAGGEMRAGDDVEIQVDYARVLRQARADLIERLRAAVIGADGSPGDV